MNVRELIDQRNALVKQSREIIDAAPAEGLTPEQRTTLEKIDKDIDTRQKDLDLAKKVEEREAAARSGGNPNAPRNEPEKRKDAKSEAKDHASKVNAEFRSFILSDSRGEFSFKGREMRDMQADVDVKGGYTVPDEQFNAELIQGVKNETFMYAISRTFTLTNAESLGTPSLESFATNAVWGTELSIGNADTGMTFGKRSLTPHPLATYALVSKKLLRASNLGPEAIVRDNLSYAIAQPSEQAFLNGNGANRPLGIFTASAIGVSTARDYISTSSSKVIADGNDIIETKYLTKQQYWGKGVWTINRFHHKNVRMLKDGNGQYLWSPAGFGNGLIPGNPDRLLDSPVYISEYAPVSTAYGSTSQDLTITGSSADITGYVASFHDPSKYWIATALDFSVEHLVEVRALQGQDVFIARVETDGMPVLQEAYARLKLKGF